MAPFSFEIPIPAPPDEVQAALIEPGFYPTLGRLKTVAAPEVVDCRPDGDRIRLSLRYRFQGQLNGAARRVLDPAKLSWLEVQTVDVADRRTTFELQPDYYRDRLSCSGEYCLTPGGDEASTSRHVSGSLRVSYPLVGSVVERAILNGIRDHLTQEATVIAEWVRGH